MIPFRYSTTCILVPLSLGNYFSSFFQFIINSLTPSCSLFLLLFPSFFVCPLQPGQFTGIYKQGHHAVVSATRTLAGCYEIRICGRHLERGLHSGRTCPGTPTLHGKDRNGSAATHLRHGGNTQQQIVAGCPGSQALADGRRHHRWRQQPKTSQATGTLPIQDEQQRARSHQPRRKTFRARSIETTDGVEGPEPQVLFAGTPGTGPTGNPGRNEAGGRREFPRIPNQEKTQGGQGGSRKDQAGRPGRWAHDETSPGRVRCLLSGDHGKSRTGGPRVNCCCK